MAVLGSSLAQRPVSWAEHEYTRNLSSFTSLSEPQYQMSKKNSFRVSEIQNIHSSSHSLSLQSACMAWEATSLAPFPPNPAETQSAALTSPSQFLISSQPELLASDQKLVREPCLPSCLFSDVPEVALVSGK